MWKHRCALTQVTGTHAYKCTQTIHNTLSRLIFWFPFVFLCPCTPVGTLSHRPGDNPSVAVKQWTFHGSVPRLWKQTAISPTLQKSMIPWVHFTNHILFTLLTTASPHCWKTKKKGKGKRKACATKRIYGYVCMATVARSYQS